MMPKGENHYNWQGGTRKRHNGYIAIMCPDHPRADKKGYVLSHVLKAEKALGKHLPDKAVVHHHSPEQLVVCQNQGYHRLIHTRMKAVKAGVNPNWRPCVICKEYDDPEYFLIPNGTGAFYHPKCKRDYQRKLYHRKKGE